MGGRCKPRYAEGVGRFIMRYFRGVWVLPSASPALGNGAALGQAGEWSGLLPPEQETSPDGSPVSSVGAAEHWMMAGGSGVGVGEDCRQIINGLCVDSIKSSLLLLAGLRNYASHYGRPPKCILGRDQNSKLTFLGAAGAGWLALPTWQPISVGSKGGGVKGRAKVAGG